MKKILLSAVLGTLFTLTINQVRADDPPYIDDVTIGSQYGFAYYGISWPNSPLKKSV